MANQEKNAPSLSQEVENIKSKPNFRLALNAALEDKKITTEEAKALFEKFNIDKKKIQDFTKGDLKDFVKEIQKSLGVKVDGIIGKNTINALKNSKAEINLNPATAPTAKPAVSPASSEGFEFQDDSGKEMKVGDTVEYTTSVGKKISGKITGIKIDSSKDAFTASDYVVIKEDNSANTYKVKGNAIERIEKTEKVQDSTTPAAAPEQKSKEIKPKTQESSEKTDKFELKNLIKAEDAKILEQAGVSIDGNRLNFQPNSLLEIYDGKTKKTEKVKGNANITVQDDTAGIKVAKEGKLFVIYVENKDKTVDSITISQKEAAAEKKDVVKERLEKIKFIKESITKIEDLDFKINGSTDDLKETFKALVDKKILENEPEIKKGSNLNTLRKRTINGLNDVLDSLEAQQDKYTKREAKKAEEKLVADESAKEELSKKEAEKINKFKSSIEKSKNFNIQEEILNMVDGLDLTDEARAKYLKNIDSLSAGTKLSNNVANFNIAPDKTNYVATYNIDPDWLNGGFNDSINYKLNLGEDITSNPKDIEEAIRKDIIMNSFKQLKNIVKGNNSSSEKKEKTKDEEKKVSKKDSK